LCGAVVGEGTGLEGTGPAGGARIGSRRPGKCRLPAVDATGTSSANGCWSRLATAGLPSIVRACHLGGPGLPGAAQTGSRRGHRTIGRSRAPRHGVCDVAHDFIVAATENVLEQEPLEIEERAENLGSERLDRSHTNILLTAIIGGGEVSLGALAAMVVVGAVLQAMPGVNLYVALALAGLVFPIGFVFVTLGRSELFTENFLIPVVSVLRTERSLVPLAKLWAISWVGNMVGCAGAAVLLLAPEGIGEPIRAAYAAYTDYKLGVPPLGVFVSAILAGGVMTTLTWSLVSVRDTVGRILVIGAAGYLLMAANLSHSIVSASVLLVGFISTEHGLADVVVWLLIATAGNLVGGLGLVTLFRLIQVRQQRHR
jgi:formate/nitrite transporter FocA (FNT family)